MSMASDSWIKLNDFEETTFKVTVKNANSPLLETDSSKIFLVEASASGVVVKLPNRLCALGHLMLIKVEKVQAQPLSFAGPGKETGDGMILEFTAKVAEVEQFDAHSMIARMQFLQFDQDKWNKLLGAISRRFTEINERLRKLRD